ncbi:fatty acid desaturase [Xylanimonas cellulosilytica DSM 15894]|uniref:Fatty acid desaturase n=1 Tax=Xylanimonas cellulosilytica (strain DSM 15894 / JCM 12276 / CECT 5975 / KCTC 9989 / LMG 20990 / NBRC 107835 / XIL07) TaxID=446471 RepID=D1BYD1_XYLCX|nr:acyl-CoA desaturase [Xylanimonas cellulosilytica]ACZ31803.1 fatty acid desaturase [Xylanimonas cellulosilytica DSM 15894]
MPLTAPTARREARTTSTYTALAQTVREVGLLRRSYGYYAWTGGVLAVALAGVVAGVVLLGDSWLQLLLAGALGILLTQFSFLAHEAAHRQVLTSGPANDRLGRFLANGVVGISYSWWMSKHSRHHANPNRVGKDPDIANDTIVFTEDGARGQRRWLRPLTRVQGWAFFPLLTLEGLNLHVTSIRSLLTGERAERRTRALELATIALRLTLYVGVVVWFLPLGLAAAFLGVQLAVFGVYMGASFAPNHKGMAIIPADSRIDFFTKQVLTSRNIRGGRVMTVLMGGLNYQIEHHLFPSMPRPHLTRARELVREHCASHGVPYTETGLLRSYAIVVRYLNEVGLAARDPFDCPAYHRLRGV